MPNSPFSSIYSHEEEHRQMLKNKGGDGLVHSFDSMSEFQAAGGATTNPGPVWIEGQLYFDGAFVAGSQSGVKNKASRLYPLQTSSLVIAGSNDYNGSYTLLYGRGIGADATKLYSQSKAGDTTF